MISLDLRSLGRTCVQKEEGRMCAVGRMSQRVTHDEKDDLGSCIIMAENNLSIGALDLFKRCNCIGVLEDKNRTEQNSCWFLDSRRQLLCSISTVQYTTAIQSHRMHRSQHCSVCERILQPQREDKTIFSCALP